MRAAPHDPSTPDDTDDTPETSRLNSGSFRIREYTPIEPMEIPRSNNEKRTPSAGFIITTSIILGIILGGAALVNGLGNSFYVPRSEFTTEVTINAKEKQHFQDENNAIKQTLERFETTLSKQDDTLQKVAESVQGIRIDMARWKR